MKTRAIVTVSGRVQGVNFRYYTKQTAERLNVTALVDWCRTGPAAARVDGVTVEKGAATGEFFGFDVRH